MVQPCKAVGVLRRLGFRLGRQVKDEDAEWARQQAEVAAAARSRAAEVVAAGQEPEVRALTQMLFRLDPIGINFEHNTDEYEAEAETITLRRAEVFSVPDAQRVVHEEFVHWFGADIAGPPSRYAAVAREVCLLWQVGTG